LWREKKFDFKKGKLLTIIVISIVQLGNCNFAMQTAVGTSYIFLNGTFWCMSSCSKSSFWDLSRYSVDDVTPPCLRDAHLDNPISESNEASNHPGERLDIEKKASYTRTLWYAIQETKKTGWIKRSGAVPDTAQWDEWLKLAWENRDNPEWEAVGEKVRVVDFGEGGVGMDDHVDGAVQHVPGLGVRPME
jgi:hypothetical protein